LNPRARADSVTAHETCNEPQGNLDKGVAFLADDYCKDQKQNRESVRKLLGLSFEAMTFAHGNPIAKGAKARVQALFA